MKIISLRFSSSFATWMIISFVGQFAAAEEALSPQSINCPPQFKVELLRSARAGEDSWISMTFGKQGKIILGLDTVGVGQLELGDDFRKPEDDIKFTRLDGELKHCRGVLWAHNSLYVDGTNSNRIDRLQDKDNDGKFETRETIVQFDYRSRYGHGSNQMRLGPDGKIYVVVGNDCSFPADVLETSPYKNPQNDWLIPNSRDKGHDNRVGYILRMDKDGKQREIVAGGLRNPVDLAFNRHGEMFTFDADMEWDVGAPWYRPIRINHIVSGGEDGWRWGTGKMPDYYPDSLPSNLDVGLGSPTGVASGHLANLPEKYREALFLADWQNGRILVAHPKLAGASYRFDYESFADGTPLNVCDLEFGPDGNLYFITGGRGSMSALYRISWQGSVPTSKQLSLNKQHYQRRMLEKFHTQQQSNAVDSIWPFLGVVDPWLRFAARVAIERQDPKHWHDRVFASTARSTSLEGLLALVRTSKTTPETRSEFISRVVNKIESFDRLGDDELVKACRIYAILFSRHGQPSESVRNSIRTHLEPRFPHSGETVNRELCELLIYAGSKKVLNESIELLQPPVSQETQFEIARLIASLPIEDWSDEQIRSYLEWLNRARQFRGGRTLLAELQHVRQGFVNSIPAATKIQLQNEIGRLNQPIDPVTFAAARKLVQQWTMKDIEELSSEAPIGDELNGRKVFVAAQCSRCHRKDDLGGQIGPDLTTVGKRFTRRVMLESIVHPSKVIDSKYAQVTYILTSGKTVSGRAAHVSKDRITVETDPLAQSTVDISRDEIESTSNAKTSPMPTGLLDYFSKDEIRDLLKYLGSAN
jgi:putative heme-binding domain-containing protein